MDGTDAGQDETRRLRHNVEWALRRALDPSTVLPMLHRLSRLAADGSDENLYAQRRLAELLCDHHPWRAALSARRVLAVQPSDDGAWAILALCYARLGNFRSSAAAYRRALELAPDNTSYAHNLGHLLDVALGRPADALPWLRLAYEAAGRRTDVAASFAQALGRAGQLAEARRVSRRALRSTDTTNLREHLRLARWLADGAPDEGRLLPRRLPPVAAPWRRESATRSRRRAAPAGAADEVRAVLDRGLASLPLDAKQRGRARALASDAAIEGLCGAAPLGGPGGPTVASLAAAIAYAVVYLDDVPLTQAEVAACFRVSLPALRGLFKALRTVLDLTPGDARVAVERPR